MSKNQDANHKRRISHGSARNINVDGTVKTGREWAEFLCFGCNYINRYRQKYGEEATVKFIRESLTNGRIKKNQNRPPMNAGRIYTKGKIKDRDVAMIFSAMIRRCYSKKSTAYPYYGKKGIRVCMEWRLDPSTFESWAVHNRYHKGLTVDRYDNKADYSPENCRIVTKSDNSKWQTKTHQITLNGVTDSGIGWDRRLGYCSGHINYRIRKYGYEQTVEGLKNIVGSADVA